MPQQNTNKAIREKVNILQPSQEVINVKGKLFYHESSQSHSIIKLTKEIISNYIRTLFDKFHCVLLSYFPRWFTIREDEG